MEDYLKLEFMGKTAKNFVIEFLNHYKRDDQKGLFGNLGLKDMSNDLLIKAIFEDFKEHANIDLAEWVAMYDGTDKFCIEISDCKHECNKIIREVTLTFKDKENDANSRVNFKFDVSSGYFCLYKIFNPSKLKDELIEAYSRKNNHDTPNGEVKSIAEITDEINGVIHEKNEYGKFHR